MQIALMDQVSEETVQAFDRLIPQLTHHSAPPNREALVEMAESDYVHVFLAWLPDQAGRIVGTATLGTFRTPTGHHGWIEDVVVDKEARRQGIGKALTEACLEKAKEIGLREVNLTSRSARCAANQLYQAMGFIRRDTNLYRYPIQRY